MKAEEVEESLRKRFKKELFTPFCKAINEYDLIQPNDKIAVCISGGKDSFLLAKLFQELKHRRNFMEERWQKENEQNDKINANSSKDVQLAKQTNILNKTEINSTNANNKNLINEKDKLDHHGKNKENRSFELVFLCMDPGYNKKNRQMIEKNSKLLNIPITFFETDIFANVENVEKSPCYLCARMRRGYLYSKAKELGCNKIALGHHFDDVIETILMGVLYSGQFQTMMPKLKSTNFNGMQLIRPMYLIREVDILQWCKYNNLKFIQCACKFTEGVSNKEMQSKRKETKTLIANLKKENPFVETNIFKSTENVNLSTIISYKKGNKIHHFLEDF